MKKLIIVNCFLVFLFAACETPNPNLTETGTDELKSLELDHAIDKSEMAYQDVIYVPIYSDIYLDLQNQKTLLAATLSIRNTSYEDSLFISKIDYFDTEGNLVRNYIENPISLPPMATVNYVVERDDDTGGPGANFIVALNGKHTGIRPIIQAVMIGQSGNKGFSFVTDGYSTLSDEYKKDHPIN